MNRKEILLPVIASILLHVTLLAVAGIINLNDKIVSVDVFSVSIKEPEVKPEPIKEKKTKGEIKSARTAPKRGTVTDNDNWREETIDLGSLDIKYIAYLTKIKRKILRIWKYPQKAFEENKEGDVVVKMSIDTEGRLAGVTLLSSSGSTDLDNGALSVVQEAAPYEPLPGNYNLSRLHIIASFNYKIMD